MRHRHPQIAPPGYLTPNSIAAVRELAELIAAGEWAPASYRRADGQYVVEKIVLGIMHGAAVGLGPFAAVHAIAVIDGQPTIWGDGALALVERSGLIEDMREDYTVDDAEGLTAICTMRRRPWPTPITRRFSMTMAEEAGLTQKEGPWKTYPRRMLMMRARSWTLRDGFADVLRGLSIREEVADYACVSASEPEPAFANRSVSRWRHPIARPRFADHSSRRTLVRPRVPATASCTRAPLTDQAPPTPGASMPGTYCSSLLAAADVPSADVTTLAGDHESIGTVEKDCTPGSTGQAAVSPTTSPTKESAEGSERPASVEGVAGSEPSGSAGYALIDEEGSFIDVDTLGELRAEFDRLLANPHLSGAQVLGLWESNAGAREELERAFSFAALAEADLRRKSAEQERQCSAHPATARRSNAGGRSTRSHTKLKDLAADACQELKPHPACSHDELFQLYRSRLIRLKRRRVKAATFIDFREANRAIEDLLHQHLPDRSAEIDALYHWAAVHAG